jgi:hypothetical protein
MASYHQNRMEAMTTEEREAFCEQGRRAQARSRAKKEAEQRDVARDTDEDNEEMPSPKRPQTLAERADDERRHGSSKVAHTSTTTTSTSHTPVDRPRKGKIRS